ncbi:MAG: ComF family protein [Clostridium sp.]|nr:ComF family protein [Clostridium sp.]MCM1171660.1 ComF family protein [Clostridium sp.]MCM1207808.1 ComF family protein [Ruminococcus sp.]
MNYKLKTVADKVLNLVYPPSCALCGDLLSKGERYICTACDVLLPRVTEPTCFKCGKEISDDEAELCEDCLRHERSFVRGFPAMNYDETFQESIAAFKYHGKKDYGKYFAYEIARSRGRDIVEAGPEVLIPIPLHKKKLRKRGYNQAEVVARELGQRLGIPVDDKILIRTVNTLPQKRLNNVERENNLKKAFHSHQKRVKYNKVMLVDDIYTTGATVEACTKVLHNIGVKDIYYTSICIGRGC